MPGLEFYATVVLLKSVSSETRDAYFYLGNGEML